MNIEHRFVKLAKTSEGVSYAVVDGKWNALGRFRAKKYGQSTFNSYRAKVLRENT